jgi:hypothetical protein
MVAQVIAIVLLADARFPALSVGLADVGVLVCAGIGGRLLSNSAKVDGGVKLGVGGVADAAGSSEKAQSRKVVSVPLTRS